MATTKVIIPDFDFSTFYYQQCLDALIRFKRQNVPELTDESDFEPFTQLLRAYALVSHLNNTLLDMVANESTLPTAKLAEQVRNMLRLIDYEMKSAAPAQADIVYVLSKVFTASGELVSEGAQLSTTQVGERAAVYFEALNALNIDATDVMSFVFSEDGGVFTDNTVSANTAVSWLVWASPAVGDSVYFGHNDVMWDELNFVTLPIPAVNIIGVWEYYDGVFRKTQPAGVTDLGGSLRFDLTSYLGAQNRAGTKIRVELGSTTAFEDVVSQWNGSTNYADTGLLGQNPPSTDPTRYIIGSDWEIMDPSTVDETSQFMTPGKLKYPLPQTLTRNWTKGKVNGQTCFWVRFRIVAASGPTSPTLSRVRIDSGKQYGMTLVTQGQTTIDAPLGSSSGLPNQSFVTSRDFFIDGSDVVTVDNIEWLRVSNFLSSAPTDNHYQIKLGKNERATVVFGDGVAGRIPPIGVGNIACEYRYGANADGNVGALTATIDKSGLTYVSNLYNPRNAVGWAEAQGASDTSLELVKVLGPASLRTKTVAIGPDDAVDLTVGFVDSFGARPFARARAFEEGAGPKTVELVVVANGGGLASNDQLAALELYFNGDTFAHPPIDKHFVANQEVVAFNYSQKVINIVATVTGPLSSEVIEAQLRQVFQPTALKEDGITYEWDFGAPVPLSRIVHEIFQADASVVNVVLTSPVGDVVLNNRELPVIGTITIALV